MIAHPGDEIIVRGHQVGEHERKGQVIEAHGDGDGPPFLVRWDEDGHESLYFPGSDAFVKHLTRPD
ncbi:MAG: hypothetical protein CL424_03235 [Acidimicrobiaceae bacterium]|nr:hypothetical protein [Acidimicrobiaceae bacterium]